MSDLRSVKLRVNGVAYEKMVESRMTLADFLRHEIGLTGTHIGCEHGVCGACTVLLEGRTTRACLMLAVQVDGKTLTTVEGLASGNELNVLQQAFWDKHGLQCGFCTPGVLMTLTELLEENADPSEAEIRDALSGHLCRCTGYHNIVVAALEAAARLRGK